MRNKLRSLCCGTLLMTAYACTTVYTKPDAPINEVPFTQVHLNDSFWTPRIETNRIVSIPSAFKECEKNGRFDNFAIAGGLMKGEHRGDFSFDDTDPYKIIEGASYSLAVKYDKKLDAYLDSVIHLIASAQEPDGYLTSLAGGADSDGRKSTVTNFITVVTSTKPLLPTIKLPANEHYWTWQLKMLTWYAKYSVPTKVKSMFHPDIRL